MLCMDKHTIRVNIDFLTKTQSRPIPFPLHYHSPVQTSLKWSGELKYKKNLMSPAIKTHNLDGYNPFSFLLLCMSSYHLCIISPTVIL